MRKLERDTRIINTAGSLGTIYARLAFCEILLLYVTKCLGMPDEQWATVAAILPLANLFHMLGAYLTERFRHRKYFCLIPFIVARTVVPALLIIPFVQWSKEFNYRFVLIALFIHAALGAMGTPPWLSWVADIVPPRSRGKFFSKRFVLATSVDALFMVVGGAVIDYFAHAHALEALQNSSYMSKDALISIGYTIPGSYLLLFGVAFLAGELDLIIQFWVKERRMPKSEQLPTIAELTISPLKHKDWRNLTICRSFLAIMDGICGPFASLYLFNVLGLKARTVGILLMLYLVTNALTYKLWERLGNKAGYRTVLAASCIISGVGMGIWWFFPYNNYLLLMTMISICFISQGLGISGINLSLNTLILNVSPEKNRSFYFAQMSVIYCIVVSLSVFFGRWVFLNTNPAEPVMFTWWHYQGAAITTKLTGVHVLTGIMAIVRIAGGMWFTRLIPDALSEKTGPHLTRMLITNPLRVFPAIMSPAPLILDEGQGAKAEEPTPSK